MLHLHLLLGTSLGDKNRSSGNLLAINLSSVHILHGQLCVIGIRVVHIAVATANTEPLVHREVNILDLSEATEDLHDMLLGHITTQPANVNTQGTWGHRSLATLLVQVRCARGGLSGAPLVLLILVRRHTTSLVILVDAAAPLFAVTRTATNRFRLAAASGGLVLIGSPCTGRD